MTMLSLIPCEAGSVVLVPFRFTSGGGVKNRPAVILSCDAYHTDRADAVMIALSTRMGASYFGDYELSDWRSAGLPAPTKVKGIMQTIERSMIIRRLGSLTSKDFTALQDTVKAILGIARDDS